jgi:hypothetical protein
VSKIAFSPFAKSQSVKSEIVPTLPHVGLFRLPTLPTFVGNDGRKCRLNRVKFLVRLGWPMHFLGQFLGYGLAAYSFFGSKNRVSNMAIFKNYEYF